MNFTLLIWEQVPEDTKLFLIPNKEVETEEILGLLKEANGKFINQADYNRGLAFLNVALVPEENKDEDMYFTDEQPNDKGITWTKPEWRCMLSKYRVLSDEMIEANITRVVLSGFVM